MALLDLAYDFFSWKTLINIFLEQDTQFPIRPLFFAACWILHPREGMLKEIPDLTKIQNDTSFVDIKNALKKGVIEERLGSGEDYGRILLKNSNYEELLGSLDLVRQTLKYSFE